MTVTPTHNTTHLAHEVIRASAGTGKTYALSARYIRLLHEGASPDTILATTFTRKAAGEILERVMCRLAEACDDRKAAEQLRQDIAAKRLACSDCLAMLVRLCRSLHRLSICTIDSFFHQAAQCLRFELDIPRNALVTDSHSAQATQLRRQAIDAVLADNDLPVMLELLRMLQRDDASRSVSDSIDAAVAGEFHSIYRQYPDPSLWSQLAVPPGKLSRGSLAEAIETMRSLSERMPSKAWAEAHRNALDAAQKRDWPDFVAKGLAKSIAAGQSHYRQGEIPAEVVGVYQTLIDHARAESLAKAARRTTATHRLLERFDGHYAGLRRDAGLLLYDDIPLKLAIDVPTLGDDLASELYFRMDARVEHLLLDEFQDTSLLQWRVLEPLVDEILAYGDGSRSFFCVGDQKQAVYGWRGGCAELFDQVESRLVAATGAGRRLNHSYRSAPAVLESVGALFATLATNEALARHEDDVCTWADRFEHHTAERESLTGYVELVASPGAIMDESADADDEGQAGSIATKTHHHTFVADQITAIANGAPGYSIGVLVQTNQAVTDYLRLLRDRGVAASGEGGASLLDDPAVELIISAITLADHPGDTAAAFHVANSPLGVTIGLTPQRWWETRRAAWRIRRDLLSQGYSRVIADWAQSLAAVCDGENVRRLTQLINLADRYDPALTLRPSDFVRFVSTTRVADPMPATVRVMTVNQAKGLEFEAVVLPDLQRKLLRSDDATVFVDRDSPTGTVRAIHCRAYERELAASPELMRAYLQWQTTSIHDSLSKLYVAMTRAVRALYMYVRPITHTNAGAISAEGWSTASYASILRRGLSTLSDTEFTGSDVPQTLYSLGESAWADDRAVETPSPRTCLIEHEPTRLTRLRDAPGSRPHRAWLTASPSSLGASSQIHIGDLLAVQPDSGRLRGSLLHAWLSKIDWLDADGQPATPIPECVFTDAARATAQGMPDAWIAARRDEFVAAINERAVRDALLRPDLNHDQSVDCWRERPFAVFHDGQLLRGVFDRVTIIRSKTHLERVQLIDFKTDRIPPDRLAEVVERYSPQVKAYRGALASMLRVDQSLIDAALLFIDAGIRHDL